MRDRGGDPAYADLVATAGQTVERSGAVRAAQEFGVDELLGHTDGSSDEDLAVLAFLEAQGYHAGVSSVLSRFALVDLVRQEHADLSGVLYGELRVSRTARAAVQVVGWSAGLAVAVERPGDGLLLTPLPLVWPADTTDPAPDPYVVAVEPDLVAATTVVAEPDFAAIRPSVLGRLRLGAAAETLGACSRMLDDTVDYVKQRRQFGQPLAHFPPVREMLAWAATERHQLRALLDATAALPAGTEEWVRATTVTKALAGRVGQRITQHTLQATGGIGFTWEYSHHRLARRTLSLDAVGGTSSALAVELGRAVRENAELPDFVSL